MMASGWKTMIPFQLCCKFRCFYLEKLQIDSLKVLEFKKLVTSSFTSFFLRQKSVRYLRIPLHCIFSGIQQIVILQKKAVRIINFQPRNSHTSPPFKQTFVLKFSCKIFYLSANLFKKYLFYRHLLLLVAYISSVAVSFQTQRNCLQRLIRLSQVSLACIKQ